MANCYACKAEIVFDNEHIGKNGKKIPLDPFTKQPHDCPMRENKTIDRNGNVKKLVSAVGSGDIVSIRMEEEKDDHGNESFSPKVDVQLPPEQPLYPTKTEYVDHTAKPQLKLKTITDPTPEGMDLKYNKLAAEYNVKFSQYHPLGSLYTIAVYYEETN